MPINISTSCRRHLEVALQQPYFKNLVTLVKAASRRYALYPLGKKIFSAGLCSFEDTQVVTLGQDPYYKPQQTNTAVFL